MTDTRTYLGPSRRNRAPAGGRGLYVDGRLVARTDPGRPPNPAPCLALDV